MLRHSLIADTAHMTRTCTPCLRYHSIVMPLQEERLVTILLEEEPRVTEIKLRPGEAIIINGNTVHAGGGMEPSNN